MSNHLKTIAKSDDELRVANYMVLFGGRDLVGEFFTKNTVFESGYTGLGLLYVDFEHGMDVDRIGNDDSCVIGTIDWKSAKVDENGIYVERILRRRAEHMQFIEELIDAGYMGTSSAAIPGKTTKKSSGEIVEWPLMRDSLTVTPMEPRMLGENVLSAAKSLHAAFPKAKSLAKLCGVTVEGPNWLKGIEEIEDLSGMERHLREVGGVSRSEAKALVSRMLSIARREVAPDNSAELKALAAALNRRNQVLTT